MSIRLDPTQRRIVGSLIEKQLTTPDQYPLTLNALLLACNQRNNRDPITEYREHEVAGAIRSLMDRGWVSELERSGGRAVRYQHHATAELGVDEHELALLAELLLRGPQSAPELKTRASRMRPFDTPEAVEARLEAMAKRPAPYVEFLGRRPGERVPRWRHLLASEPATSAADSVPVDAARPPTDAEAAPAAPPSRPARPDSGGRPDGDDAARLAELADRVDRLERAVAELRATLGG